MTENEKTRREERLVSASSLSSFFGRLVQGIYINRYTYQSCWNVFLRGSAGGGEQPTDLSEFQRFLICNDV